jgi:hypothetical protein
MKRFKLLLFLTIIFSLSECSKESSTNSTTNNNFLIKKQLELSWHLVEKKSNGTVVTPTPKWDIDFYDSGNYYMNKDAGSENGTWDLSSDGIYIVLTKQDSTIEKWQIVDISSKILRVRLSIDEYTYNPY